ncbi:hypothetical protein QYF36_021594 [Acer negundo]|nr:hypothetical protein QYF36_021594 [Acer negundo]
MVCFVYSSGLLVHLWARALAHESKSNCINLEECAQTSSCISFVTHRIAIRPTGSEFSLCWKCEHCAMGENKELSVYLSEWLLPPLKFSDKFAVLGDGTIVLL